MISACLDLRFAEFNLRVVENKTYIYPKIPTTIKTMGVNITTIAYLRVSIFEIGSTIILMVVEAQGKCIYIYIYIYIPESSNGVKFEPLNHQKQHQVLSFDMLRGSGYTYIPHCVFLMVISHGRIRKHHLNKTNPK